MSKIINKIITLFRKLFGHKDNTKNNIANKSTSDIYFQDLKNTNPQDKIDDESYIKKDENKKNAQEAADIIVEKLRKSTSGVRPNHFHHRDLDVEVGGLEQKEQKEARIDDIWDNRSEEVDEVSIEGNRKAINTTGKRSMLWRIKKNKKDKTERLSEEMEIAENETKKHTDKVKQERSQDNSKGGGMSR